MQKATRKIVMPLLALLVITVVVVGSIEAVLAKGSETRLEARMNPGADGKAKFEERDDRTRLSVEIEGQVANTTYEIFIDGDSIGIFTTNAVGFADLNLDSRDGDSVPSVNAGDLVEVKDVNGNAILSGTFSPK